MDEGKQRPALTNDGECPSGGAAAAAPPGLYEEEVAGRRSKRKVEGGCLLPEIWLCSVGTRRTR